MQLKASHVLQARRVGRSAKKRSKILYGDTALYTRVATKTIQQVMSPLEHIALKLKDIRSPS